MEVTPNDIKHLLKDALDERVSLKEHFEAILNARDEAVRVGMDTLNRRLGEMNNFRESSADILRTMATKGELDRAEIGVKAEIAYLSKDVQSLRESRAEMSGKASQEDVQRVQDNTNKALFGARDARWIAWAALGVSIIFGILNLVVK
jgi:hypothetical protein